ncbi:MAG: SLC13 family permease [Rhodospirillales bacterium]|nr:SLC13 family permease [Rhodospirillales bacterium]MBO6786148.1 SLC13 family permease [Rhodospirillales bacterium]
MWVTYAIILIAFAAYVAEKWPMELTSLGTICAILLFFQFFQTPADDGQPGISAARILEGFANTALIAVLSLLVMGQGLIRTGILDRGAQWLLDHLRAKVPATVAIFFVLFIVGAVSGFLNNTPVVVIFIPLMQAMAHRYHVSPSRIMIPLSFAAILGGMTTLIGSSTNLLVNTALIEIGEKPLGFFDFTAPGVILALAGLVYAVFVAPRILPDRAGMADSVAPEGAGKQFIVQIETPPDSELIGKSAVGGHFKALPNMTVRMIQRGERAILPPFEDTEVIEGDVIVVAATRPVLKEAIAEHGELFHPDLRDGKALDDDDEDAPWRQADQVLAEVMIAPASRLVGQTLRLAGFRYKTGCIVLGIQRRARMIRARITEIRLEAGDVLLVQGQRDDIRQLRGGRDAILIESSREDLPQLDHVKRATFIFLGAVIAAATGMVPIVVSAFAGAVAMVATGVLNLRQAFRAIDPKIATAIAAALAMSIALQETGGAAVIAHGMVSVFEDLGPLVILSLLFLVAALMTNVISNNAVAVLFTPIAVDLAIEVGAPPMLFAIAMVFAANCSFASPMGYQTNLLVMGPGHYRFQDFIRAGLPLIFIVWIVFTLLAKFFWKI